MELQAAETGSNDDYHYVHSGVDNHRSDHNHGSADHDVAPDNHTATDDHDHHSPAVARPLISGTHPTWNRFHRLWTLDRQTIDTTSLAERPRLRRVGSNSQVWSAVRRSSDRAISN